MKIILAQRIDYDSEYEDVPFVSYHYPKSYRNQISEGDLFIYYQGDKSRRENRYYFGTGVVGNIEPYDENSFVAQIENGFRFPQKVPIYLEDNSFVESIGYESVRQKPTPAWQNSIRKISERAFNEILRRPDLKSDYVNTLQTHAHILSEGRDLDSIEQLNSQYSNSPPEKRAALTRAIVDRGNRISKALKEILGAQCQICGHTGFLKRDGSPYIEAHHLDQLANLNPKSLCSENIVLLCPNCHREIHYGKDVSIQDAGDYVEVKLSRSQNRIRKNSLDFLRDSWNIRNGHGA